MEYCFWILTDGTIVKPDSKHILAVKAAPAAFGETEESLNKTFVKYGEEKNNNVESKARQEIMLRVISRKHIRIRKYVFKHCQHWIIQLYKLTEEKRLIISAWAATYVDSADDKHADVIIHELHNDTKIKTSLNQLAAEYNGIEDSEIVSQAELVRRYV